MDELRKIFGLIRLSFFNPRLLLSKYDSPVDNYYFQDVVRLFRENKIEEKLIEDLIKSLSLPIKAVSITDKDIIIHPKEESISLYEIKVLATLCRALNPKKALEIGTFKGRTTVNLAKNTSPKTRIYTLNLPQEKCDFQVGKWFKDTPYAKKIKQIFHDSKTFDFSTLPKMDFIFVDGGHDYSTVKKDTQSALNILDSGGTIVWHDVDICHLGSTKAVFEQVKKNNLHMS